MKFLCMDSNKIFILVVSYFAISTAYDPEHEVDLLNTATATSNLRGWLIKTYVNGLDAGNTSIHGWEELSFNGLNTTQRGFQVCPEERDLSQQTKVQSWLRTPLLNVQGIFRIYTELNFWMRVCNDLKKTVCRETFKVFHRLTDSNETDDIYASILNDTFYSTIDTVAAESRFSPSSSDEFKINTEIVRLKISEKDQITSDQRSGVYIAIVDEGACMALTSIRIYHKVCPEVVARLANFSRTHTGPSDTYLVEVSGKCVENSVADSSRMNSEQLTPLYHCASSGEWKVRTGYCLCNPGYEPDDDEQSCMECPMNTYKSNIANDKCSPCPPDSFTTNVGATYCQCESGDHSLHSSVPSMGAGSALLSHHCEICSELPSAPVGAALSVDVKHAPGTIQIAWNSPDYLGRCHKVTYCVVCQACPARGKDFNSTSDVNNTRNNHESLKNHCSLNNGPFSSNHLQDGTSCDGLLYFPSKCNIGHRHVTVGNLRGQTDYKFTVVTINGVTIEKYPESFSMLENTQSSLGVNITTRSLSSLSMQMQKLLGTSGASVLHTTSDTLPSVVNHIRIINKNFSSVTVHWDPPTYTNGKLMGYQVKWYPSSSLDATGILSGDSSTSSKTVARTETVIKGLTSGMQYKVAVRALNSAGMGNFSNPLQLNMVPDILPITEQPTSQLAFSYIYLIAALIVIISLIVASIVAWFKCSNRRRKDFKLANTTPLNYDSVEAPEAPTAYTDLTEAEQRTYVDPFSLGAILPHTFKCETKPALVTATTVIGCGEFGEVYQGTLIKKDPGGQEKDQVIDVAVKQLHAQCQPHEQLDFLREAMALEKFKHPNIVKLEAVVTTSRPFMIVTELMKHGCLGAFLRSHQEANRAFPPLVLVRMLRGVARGMAYLSRLNYVHRDLAARNVLINNELVCKVADFGLTRKLGEDEDNNDNSCKTYTTQGGKIAIRWTAPEAVAYRAYSQASDVWSFGVFAWEVTTYGEKPYWNLTNQQVLQALSEGFRLPAPEDCPSILHQLMLDCWHCDRQTRPTFPHVVSKLDHMIENADVLQTLASPASTGADEMFFVESPPHTPVPIPTVSDGQAHHKYATCQIVTDDNVSHDSSDDKKGGSSTAALFDQHSINEFLSQEELRTTDTSSVSDVRDDVPQEATESTVMLESTQISDNLHFPSSSTSEHALLNNGKCITTSISFPNGDASVKQIYTGSIL